MQQQIAEQKRSDVSTCGALRFSDIAPTHPVPNKENVAACTVQLLLPVDIKKQRRTVKQLFMDRGIYLHAVIPLI